MNFAKNQRRFELVRAVDETGVSGTGLVAEGCLWSDGSVSLRWMSECASVIFYNNIQSVIQVHGHKGKTQIHWLDPDGLVFCSLTSSDETFCGKPTDGATFNGQPRCSLHAQASGKY